MKLYATVKNERGGKKSTGDDIRILIELTYGNKIVGEIGLYAINNDKVKGYRIVWKDPDKGFNPNNILKEEEKGITLKGKICEITRCNTPRVTHRGHKSAYCSTHYEQRVKQDGIL